MDTKKIGAQTVALASPPVLLGWGNAVGQKEGAGPLGRYFSFVDQDDTFGEPTWEKAESTMQKKALTFALQRAARAPSDLDYLLAGDLLNQCIATAYAARDAGVPFFGLYGACSTMAESLSLGAMLLDGGFGQCIAAVTSSHFCSAERQYRNPLEYGSQKPPTAQWTTTGAGAVILGRTGDGPRITHITTGQIVDKGIPDANNMGAAMAPAAYETLSAHFADTGRDPDFYDCIVTGDLGALGKEIVLDFFRRDGMDLSPQYDDCGVLLFDPKTQDVHAGGSGCGCSAVVLTGYLLHQLQTGAWKDLLFCGTGALHSPTSVMQGQTIPGICHGVAITAGDPKKGGRL